MRGGEGRSWGEGAARRGLGGEGSKDREEGAGNHERDRGCRGQRVSGGSVGGGGGGRKDGVEKAARALKSSQLF